MEETGDGERERFRDGRLAVDVPRANIVNDLSLMVETEMSAMVDTGRIIRDEPSDSRDKSNAKLGFGRACIRS